MCIRDRLVVSLITQSVRVERKKGKPVAVLGKCASPLQGCFTVAPNLASCHAGLVRAALARRGEYEGRAYVGATLTP